MDANKEAAEAWAQRAAAAMKDGDLAAALRFCEKSLRLNPDDARVQSLRQRVVARQAGEDSPSSSARASSPQQRSAGAEQSHRSADNLRSHGQASSSSAPQAAGEGSANAARARPNVAARSAAGARQPSSVQPPAPLRPHTPEQAEAVRAIKTAKDYYEVLGVTKNATSEDIKRGYRKQAQKVHPDKCPAPGADEAFKRVGAAFTILSDAEKRAHYDRFGGDEASVSSGTQGGGRDFARRQHYARYEEEISPEDIFNMFFGGGLPPGGMRVRGGFRTTQANFHQQHAGNQQQQQQPGNARFVQLLQLLPLLLLFLFSILSFRSGGDDKLFGLTRDDVFRTERKTSLYGVTSGLPYFVKDDFWSRVSSDRSILTRVERMVESELYSSLSRACSAETQRRAVVENQLKYASSAAREKLRLRLDETRTPSCDTFSRYFGTS